MRRLGSRRNFASAARPRIPAHWRSFSRRGTSLRRQRFDSHKEEFDSRSDVFTHDAFAWSLAAAGNLDEAHSEMHRALAEGTEDGRLFFHAAIIASRAGHTADAKRWLRKASGLSHLLLPSERNELQNLAAWDAKQNAFSAPSSQKTLPLGRNTERKSKNQTKT